MMNALSVHVYQAGWNLLSDFADCCAEYPESEVRFH